MCAGTIRLGLPSTMSKPTFISGIAFERLDQRVADQVREGDLAAAGAGQVVVDDDAVVDEQLDRHRADAGRGRHRQAEVHVLRGARRGAAQHLELGLVAGLGLGRGLSGSLGTGAVVDGAAAGRRRGVASRRRRGLRRRGAFGVDCCGAAGSSAGRGRGFAGAAGWAGALGAAAAAPLVARWSRDASHRGVVLEEGPTTPCPRCSGPAGSARTSRRRATRWRRTPPAGCRGGWCLPKTRPRPESPLPMNL